MSEYFSFRTRAGTFRIKREGDRWRPYFEEEKLMGTYLSPQHAVDDLAIGATDWPSCGDPSELGISDDISDWSHIKRCR